MVILLDKNKRPYGWCKPKHARKLLQKGEACVYRQYPFILILKHKDVRQENIKHNYRIKIDPGAVHTGMTVIENDTVVLFLQIEHKAKQVVKDLETRRNSRRNRRTRETRYRKSTFQDGGKFQTSRPDGWLPPSQRSIVGNTETWVKRLAKWLGDCDASIEYVKFDTQLLENPDIEGEQYQQGTLQGYEMKSYLREKYNCTCQYCGDKTNDHRLEWEHKIPRSRGGSDSAKNATLACHTCNQAKGNLTPEEWLQQLQKQKETELTKARKECLAEVIQGKTVNKQLRYSAWSNTTRNELVNRVRTIKGVKAVELSTGGTTSYNRHQLGYEKDHHIDALCVGHFIPKDGFKRINQPVLYITAKGRGSRMRGQTNKCGVIITKWYNRKKQMFGFQTGDIVRATVIRQSKYKGIHAGRIKGVRANGYFDVRRFDNSVVTVKAQECKLLQGEDGYEYKYA